MQAEPKRISTFDPGLIGRLRGRAELLTPNEMGQADQAAMRHGHPGPELMEAAGRAVVRAMARHIGRCRVLVLAGPGNNGGDGYIAARLLAQQGWPVRLAAQAPPKAGSDAAWAASLWHGPNVPFTPDEALRSDVVVDAVFGAGLTRPVSGLVAETLKAAKRVVAVDVPSGLDGATGLTLGYAPSAELTVTFFRLKPGHLLLPGRDLCGRIELADIGIPGAVLDEVRPRTFANLPTLWQLPGLTAESHKYTRGHVTVIGGAEMTGAARLAAEAARRAGAGMVTIAARGAAETYRSGEPGLLVSQSDIAALLNDDRRKVWVCGPGLGPDEARAIFPALIAANRTIVGDADVFSAFTGNPDALHGAAVLTPHAGEFARVFGAPATDRLSAAREAAARTRSVVLLKGADTIIAAPDGRAAINLSAPPWLATAGAGDVLSGIIAGLLAQGMPAWDAAAAGAYLHGRAAEVAGAGLVVEDLLPALVRVRESAK
ncbi:MAG TPA: bifunctional ADP-dependent NAD(P)H-hydrate dehydratase/NAD(P)H-hydrate epimerase [Acetobacteraceae bacterium]|jgi:ADP-dependent NAD(P)H-hydrate dehydratase / NAD(P)H-hydrate epimerase|nr:bifunctional ADP-dependent NAD(P)H-hydrate dehydratase/NAD(P)H-hydrate epimerase [Acetobacteraceae bacterium]